MVLWRRTILTLLLLGLCGCAPANRDALEQEVLNADPDFAIVLEKRRLLANRIETYERELAFKRTTVKEAIEKLRRELAASAETVRKKRAETRRQMEPDRQRFEQALSLASEELRSLNAQRASINRSIKQLQEALTNSEGIWTPEERAAEEAKLHEVENDAARLDRDLAVMKQHMRLVQIKLILLTL